MATTVDASILTTLYPERSPGAHKGDFGHLFIVGGSFRYSGAPALQALAALRSGVDRVTVAAPRRAADVVATMAPDIVTVPLEGGILSAENVGILLKEYGGKTALAIGNGLGRDKGTLRAVMMLLEKAPMPVVADADALYALGESREILASIDLIATPHIVEFQAMTGVAPEAMTPAKRAAIVTEEAERLGITILLKGHHDIISNGETTAVNETGTPLMTVGGTGDVLAGVAGALIARGNSLVDAAVGAAWITGRAGEIAGEEYGESLIASDVLEAIPDAIAR